MHRIRFGGAAASAGRVAGGAGECRRRRELAVQHHRSCVADGGERGPEAGFRSSVELLS